jgi:hypothetical protein
MLFVLPLASRSAIGRTVYPNYQLYESNWIYGRRYTMAQAVHSIETEPEHTIEIVVHISESLDEQQRGNLVASLGNNDGIVAAGFCPLRYHLMLIRYDRDLYSSQVEI